MNAKVKDTIGKIAMLAGACTLSGCLSAPFVPPSGAFATVKAPLSTEGNWKMGTKQGTASSYSVLGLWAEGDCSITAAAQEGGLKTVYHADYEYTNIIGIWQKVKVVVSGE